MLKRMTLSETLANDPQMAIPSFPRLPDDLLTIWDTQSSLVVLGAPGPVVFGGKASAHLLTHLLPLMTGENSIDDIVERLDFIPAPHIHKAIALLFMRGMIEDGVTSCGLGAADVAAHRKEVAFYSRYLDLTRAFRNRYDVLAHLKRSKVLMLSDTPYVAPVLADMAALGIGQVDLYAPAKIHEACNSVGAERMSIGGAATELTEYLKDLRPEDLGDYSLICMLLGSDDQPLLRALNARTQGVGTRIACGIIGPDCVQIGPVMQKPYSACIECARMPSIRNNAVFDPIAIDTARPHFALSYLALLTQLLPITAIDQVQTLCADTLQFLRTPMYKQPRCRICGESAGSTASALPGEVCTGVSVRHSLAWFYNENTNFRQYHMVAKGHQAHYDEKNRRAVGGALKKMENALASPLPQSEQIPASLRASYTGRTGIAPAAQADGTPAQRLGMLLSLCAGRRVFGVTEDWEVGFRTTPSAGAMASQSLYLINISVEDIAVGAHYFSPNGHLECVSERSPEFSDFGLHGVSESQMHGAIAAVVITEAYARIESKYVGIGYRYTLSDAGAMLANVKIAGTALGFGVCHTGNFFDDRLSRYLGCKSVTEHPAVICFIYGGDGGEHVTH
jgi:SagB-type dehydrogenase family enzyme